MNCDSKMKVNIFNLEDESKIPLCSLGEGQHLLGRGPTLKCQDQRVSRQHAQITINNDLATITAKHEINPCFFRAATSKHISILQFNIPVEISTNDSFGFFPDQFWFRVEINQNNNEENDDLNSIHGSSAEYGESDQTEIALDEIIDNYETAIENSNREYDLQLDNEINNENLPNSTNTSDNRNGTANVSAEEHLEERNENGLENQENRLENQEENRLENQEENRLEEGREERRIENEIETAISELRQGDIRMNQEGNSTSTNNAVNEDEQQDNNQSNEPSCSSKSPNKKFRDRCWYANQCYRKNQFHKLEFSHPGDTDYDTDPEDDRPACPYGMNCTRKNKVHRQQYRHSRYTIPPLPKQFQPPQTQQTKPSPPKKRKKPKKASSDSDNENTAGVSSKNIVKTKRQRKKPVVDSPPDDYDPFIDDSDDEFTCDFSSETDSEN